VKGLVPCSLALSDDGARLECACEDDGLVLLVDVSRLTDEELAEQVAALCALASEERRVKWTAGLVGATGRWWIARTETFPTIPGAGSSHWTEDLRGVVERLSTEIEERAARAGAAKDEAI
jgi:hypothetical protein